MRRDYRGLEADNAWAIVAGDLCDIDTAAAVLVRLDAPSWGTAMELRYAYAERKIPVVGFGRTTSPWVLAHTTAIFSQLDAAVQKAAWTRPTC